MNSNITTLVVCALLTGLLAACSTPPDVRNLADKTAANVGIISTQLQRLERNSRGIAEYRAANIAELHAANTELRARYEYDVELTKKGSGEGFLDLIRQIKDWGDTVKDIWSLTRPRASRKAGSGRLRNQTPESLGRGSRLASRFPAGRPSRAASRCAAKPYCLL